MQTTNLQGGRLEPHHAAGEISSVTGSGGSTGRLCILAGSCCRLPFDTQQHVNCVCLPRLIAVRTSEEQQNMFTHRSSSRHHQESSDGASMFEGLASASDLPVVVFNYAPFWCGSWHMSVCGGCVMGLARSASVSSLVSNSPCAPERPCARSSMSLSPAMGTCMLNCPAAASVAGGGHATGGASTPTARRSRATSPLQVPFHRRRCDPHAGKHGRQPAVLLA